MKDNRPRWDKYGPNCMDCGKPNTAYMVKDSLWKQVVPEAVDSEYDVIDGKLHARKGTGTFVCIYCFEKRLGRDLRYEDFIERHSELGHLLPINFGMWGFDVREFLAAKQKKGA